MPAGTTIKIKRKASAFVGGELSAGELGLDTTNSTLYGSVNGTTVFVVTGGGTYTHPNHTGDVTSVGDGVMTISNKVVTFAKIQDITTARLLGRTTAGTGDTETISLGGGIEFSGNTLRRTVLTGDVTATAGNNATSIANNAVTNTKAADVPTNTIKGRVTAATGDPQDLTVVQVQTLLNLPSNTVTDLSNKLNTSLKGAANGLAELDGSGLVPAAQLPSFVDDIIEVANFAALPVTGESGKIYVTLNDNKTFRWSGSGYTEVSASLALGETLSTAYRGDRGKISYDHSLVTVGNPHNVTKSEVGLPNVDNTSDVNKPISTSQQTALNLKANKSNVLELDNVTPFTPTLDHHPATKKFVLDNAGGGSGNSVKETITNANTFATGDPVYYDGADWADSDAAVVATSDVVGLVETATGSDFEIVYSGKMAWTAHGFTLGATLYLASGGGLTETEPSIAGEVSKPVAVAIDANTLIVMTLRGAEIGVADGGILTYLVPVTLTSSTSVSWDVTTGVNAILVLGHNATVTLSNLADGEEATITITQGASAYSLTLAHSGLTVRGTTDVTALTNGQFAIISIKRTGSNLFVQANTGFN